MESKRGRGEKPVVYDLKTEQSPPPPGSRVIKTRLGKSTRGNPYGWWQFSDPSWLYSPDVSKPIGNPRGCGHPSPVFSTPCKNKESVSGRHQKGASSSSWRAAEQTWICGVATINPFLPWGFYFFWVVVTMGTLGQRSHQAVFRCRSADPVCCFHTTIFMAVGDVQ